MAWGSSSCRDVQGQCVGAGSAEVRAGAQGNRNKGNRNTSATQLARCIRRVWSSRGDEHCVLDLQLLGALAIGGLTWRAMPEVLAHGGLNLRRCATQKKTIAIVDCIAAGVGQATTAATDPRNSSWKSAGGGNRAGFPQSQPP